MRTILILALLAPCGSAITASADVVDGIEMLSYSYQIHPSWAEGWSRDVPVFSTNGNSFLSTSGSPTSISTTYTSPGPFPLGLHSEINGSASIDRFNFHNTAEAGAFSQQGSDGLTYNYTGELWTDNDAEWDFRPTTGLMQIAMHMSANNFYGDYQDFSLELQEINSQTGFPRFDLTYDISHTLYRSIDVTNTYVVNPGDYFILRLRGTSDTYASDYFAQDFTASVQAIPEPATMPLLGVAAAVLMFARRRSTAPCSVKVLRVTEAEAGIPSPSGPETRG